MLIGREVIVIGEVCEPINSPAEVAQLPRQRYIRAHKLVVLKERSNASEQWLLEVGELTKRVYPKLAARFSALSNNFVEAA